MVIAGGGPTGLMLAGELALAGVRRRSQSPDAFDHAARALAVFERLGSVDEIEECRLLLDG